MCSKRVKTGEPSPFCYNRPMKLKGADKAKKIIDDNIYCVISSSSKDGKPWISPVFYGYDEDYNIYWISDKDSRHSELIRTNPQVAIVIFNSQAPEGEGDGVYFEANVEEINYREEAQRAYEIRDRRAKKAEFKVKKVEEVIGEGQWRVYKAIPYSVTKLSSGEYVNGQYVDKRYEIELK
jgi:nitroimidazol reductase NimA-like FMN-containing flavoprotein (pyridoxamine 5'-phosphate oxidase superfamily)